MRSAPIGACKWNFPPFMTYWLSSYFLWLIRMATTLANTWCTPPRATSWSSPTATLLALNPAWASSSSHLTRVFAISQNWFDTKSKGPFDQSLQQVVQYRIRLSPFDYNIKRSIFFFYFDHKILQYYNLNEHLIDYRENSTQQMIYFSYLLIIWMQLFRNYYLFEELENVIDNNW